MKIDVFKLDGFLGPDECDRIVAEIALADSREAPLYGGARAIDPVVRKALIASVSPTTAGAVSDRIEEILPVLAGHFAVELSGFEAPQFLHYRTGDHFVAHQDGNTTLIRDETVGRKVSVSIFLNSQTEPVINGAYSGGSLVLHGSYPEWEYREDITSPPGTLVAFRSETTHEVLPVTGGERFAIVAWFRGVPI